MCRPANTKLRKRLGSAATPIEIPDAKFGFGSATRLDCPLPKIPSRQYNVPYGPPAPCANLRDGIESRAGASAAQSTPPDPHALSADQLPIQSKSCVPCGEILDNQATQNTTTEAPPAAANQIAEQLDFDMKRGKNVQRSAPVPDTPPSDKTSLKSYVGSTVSTECICLPRFKLCHVVAGTVALVLIIAICNFLYLYVKRQSRLYC